MSLNNLTLIFILILFNLFFCKYFLLILSKFDPKLLVDDQFNKPQAFHESPVSICGGVGIFFFFCVFIFVFIFIKTNYLLWIFIILFFIFFTRFIRWFEIKHQTKIKINFNVFVNFSLKWWNWIIFWFFFRFFVFSFAFKILK